MEKNEKKNSTAAPQATGETELAESMSLTIECLREQQKYAAVHTYTATLNSFTAFSTSCHLPMTLDEVFTPGRLKEYEEWLRRKGLSWGTVSTYTRTLMAMYNRLFPPGTPEHTPQLFDDIHTRVESTTKRALTENQMEELLDTNLDTLPRHLQASMAYFLLMFLFRGMPFIDLACLLKTDVQGNTIVYRRHKTGKQMTVQIPKEAIPLLERCLDRNPDSPYLFPVLPPDEKNPEEIYRNIRKELRKFNKKLSMLALIIVPLAKISSYTARHTWATLSYYLGIPVGIICEALGHSSIKVTENYLKPFGNEKIAEANEQLISHVKRNKGKRNKYGNALRISRLERVLLTK